MATKAFDASKYLTDLRGKDYLEVKWRLLWLRTEHPDATIDTEMAQLEPGLAVFRARVSLPDGGIATGWGSETADDFTDYIEKAETKALGRALAALGYGTQFCEDFDFSARNGDGQGKDSRARARTAGQERVVDAPVRRGELKVLRDRDAEGATPSQVKAIYSIGRDGGADKEAIERRCRAVFGGPPGQLTKRQASRFIELLRRPGGPGSAKEGTQAGVV